MDAGEIHSIYSSNLMGLFLSMRWAEKGGCYETSCMANGFGGGVFGLGEFGLGDAEGLSFGEWQ
jgi:hypothetical protein